MCKQFMKGIYLHFSKTIFLTSFGLFAFILLLAPASVRAEKEGVQFAGKEEMNGYRFSDYVGFEKKWRLVTVRFRKDTGEMRFTFANPIAWETLVSGKTDYPDGAVFGKVGVKTGEDPEFNSSVVPDGARRYQLMVRNSQKHADTAGWGYALFDYSGKTFPEDPKLQVVACAACHNLAADRGYVFSQILDLSSGSTLVANHLRPKLVASWLKFAKINRKKIPSHVLKFIPGSEKDILVYEGEISKSVIQGTLDEIKPSLTRQVFLHGKPALFMSADGKYFSLVLEDKKDTSCGKKRAFKAIFSLIAKYPETESLLFCDEI